MKNILFVVDGAADEPLDCFQGKTALESANHPAMDRLASGGTLGLTQTIPEGFDAGTDAAFLTLFGYAGGPRWSRGALEAAGLNIDTHGYQNVLRCNLVAISADRLMLSHNGFGADDTICAKLTESLLADAKLMRLLSAHGSRLLPGASFRNFIATNDPWVGGYAPHDHLLEPAPNAPPIWQAILDRAGIVLGEASTRLNLGRPVNGIWPWSGGGSPILPSFRDRFDADGDCVCAVPVVKGVARLAGLAAPDIPGANGQLNTDWRKKVEATLASPLPFTLLHLEAPDECAHEKHPQDKVRAIELADQMLQELMKGLEARHEAYRILLMADHYTSSKSGRHLADPPPFVLFDSRADRNGSSTGFNEPNAAKTGVKVQVGSLLDMLMGESS